jgi:hypothetical protein
MEIRDWYADPVSTGFAELAWQGNYRGANPDRIPPDSLAKKKIGIYWFEWTNPHPDRRIEAIDFISAGDGPVPVLIAITATRVQR